MGYQWNTSRDELNGLTPKEALGKFTDSEIAAVLGCNANSVAYHRRQAGIEPFKNHRWIDPQKRHFLIEKEQDAWIDDQVATREDVYNRSHLIYLVLKQCVKGAGFAAALPKP